ncbi:MAG: hypothetical protein ABWX61_08145 [Paenisporosarcina sp.]
MIRVLPAALNHGDLHSGNAFVDSVTYHFLNGAMLPLLILF